MARRERGHATPQVRRQDLAKLRERPDGGAARVDGVRDDRPQPERDRDGLVIVEQERRHRAAADEPVPADAPHRRLDRVPEVAQALDVAPDRPARHLQPLGDLGARPVAAILEQGEQPQESAGAVSHTRTIPLC